MSETDSTLIVAIDGGHKAVQPWVDAFRSRLPGWTVLPLGALVEPARVRYIAAWRHPLGALAPFSGVKAVFSLGAGVDHLLSDSNLPQAPLVRIVDPDLTARMSEWVVLHVLHHHRQARRYERQQIERSWDDDLHQPAAKDVRVGVMGLGVLGSDAARKLALLGFEVAGWSRSPKAVPGLRTFAGEAELDAFLAHAQILVVLLPLTPATRGILNADLVKKLARDGHLGGPIILNAGRGGLQVEADILTCLADGTLRGATLDVFNVEPLPADSPLWTHPAVTITPHNAAVSNAAAVADFIVAQIEAHDRGEPLRHVVDRSKEY